MWLLSSCLATSRPRYRQSRRPPRTRSVTPSSWAARALRSESRTRTSSHRDRVPGRTAAGLEGVRRDPAVPDRAERPRQPADVDRAAALLVPEVPAVLDRRHPPVARAHRSKARLVVSDGDQDPLRQPRRAPVLPGKVARERRREAERRPEVGERPGLAVVAGEDRGTAALGRGERFPRPGRL